jgi:endonuclease/exonuclease/phosphatase family metal-dependent hydrolase
MPLPVRVGTYNLYLGADLNLLLGPRDRAELDANLREVERQLRATAFPGRVHALARVLARERLDLVGLQEVTTWRADGAMLWDYRALLVAALEELGEPYDVVVDVPTFTGTGTLSLRGRDVTLDLVGSNTILRRRASAVEVVSTATGMFGAALPIVALGLEATIGRGWCAARCVLAEQPGTPFTFVDTHTEAYDESSRDVQRDELLTTLPPDGEAVVLVGDFNATPDRVGMPEGLQDAWLAAGNSPDPQAAATCCQAPDLGNEDSRLGERIDYVWTRGMSVRGCRRMGADPADRSAAGLWPSDHAGVVAELELGPEG